MPGPKLVVILVALLSFGFAAGIALFDPDPA